MEQECANRVTADSMVDNSGGVEITSKPAQDHDSWRNGAYLGDRRHTQGGGEKDVEIVGTTGVKLPHNRFTCSENPFVLADEITHKDRCNLCFCYVCDRPARDCSRWYDHCHASDSGARKEKWVGMRVHAKHLLQLGKDPPVSGYYEEVSVNERISKWLPEDSEEICKVSTHINKPSYRETHRWRLDVSVGDLIDARDSDNNWFESRVTEVDVDEDPQKIKVHFIGWSNTWDMCFKRTSQDVQKLHTFTTNWRQDLQVSSKLEVLATTDRANKWHGGTVEEVKYENGKRLLKTAGQSSPNVPDHKLITSFARLADTVSTYQWLPEDSEEICNVSTHINKFSPEETLRWRSNLKVGDLIDARDTEHKWIESRVVEVNVNEDPQKIKVHFIGWSNKWDQCFNRTSQDLQKLHTITTPWRQDLQVNSKLEVSTNTNGVNRWYDGTVEEIKNEDGKRLLKVSANLVGS